MKLTERRSHRVKLVAIACVWSLGLGAHAWYYVASTLSEEIPDAYAATSSFQLLMFAIFRLPAWVALLAIALWLGEGMGSKPTNLQTAPFRFWHYFARWLACAAIPSIGYYIWLLSALHGSVFAETNQAMAFLFFAAALACAIPFAALLALAHAALKFKAKNP